MKKIAGVTAALVALASQDVMAAQNEMGTGVPSFGLYTQATGTEIRVWSLGNATVPFPAGCTAIVLRPETMGIDAFKIAAGILTTARVTGMRVRFYAHAPRDGGCGVDYVQLDG